MISRSLPGLLLCCPLLLAAQPVTVNLAVDEAHPPYVRNEAGRAVGLYVQVLELALTRMPKWELQLHPQPWKRALATAEQGDVDGVLPPYRGADRDWMAAYAGPLYREEVVVFCDARSGLASVPSWPNSFIGLRVGVPRGYFLSWRMEAAVHNGKVQRLDFNDARDSLAAMAGRQVDCVADDRFSVEFEYNRAQRQPLWAARMPASLPAPFVLESQEAFVGFSRRALARRPELAEFAKALDTQLAQLRASGEIDRLARAMLNGEKP